MPRRSCQKASDFGHMDIHNLNADIEHLSYDPSTISGNVNAFSFREKSGLVIDKFHTKFLYGPKNAYLNDLLVQNAAKASFKSNCK